MKQSSGLNGNLKPENKKKHNLYHDGPVFRQQK